MALSTRLATRLSARLVSPVTMAGCEAGLHAYAQAGGLVPAAGHDPGGHLGEVERFPAPRPALAAGQREQGVDQVFLLFAEPQQLLASCPQRFRARVGIGERHLEDGPLAVSGVRNSWDAFATKRRWDSNAASRRANRPSNVSPSSRNSS